MDFEINLSEPGLLHYGMAVFEPNPVCLGDALSEPCYDIAHLGHERFQSDDAIFAHTLVAKRRLRCRRHHWRRSVRRVEQGECSIGFGHGCPRAMRWHFVLLAGWWYGTGTRSIYGCCNEIPPTQFIAPSRPFALCGSIHICILDKREY